MQSPAKDDPPRLRQWTTLTLLGNCTRSTELSLTLQVQDVLPGEQRVRCSVHATARMRENGQFPLVLKELFQIDYKCASILCAGATSLATVTSVLHRLYITPNITACVLTVWALDYFDGQPAERANQRPPTRSTSTCTPKHSDRASPVSTSRTGPAFTMRERDINAACVIPGGISSV